MQQYVNRNVKEFKGTIIALKHAALFKWLRPKSHVLIFNRKLLHNSDCVLYDCNLDYIRHVVIIM